MKCDLKNYEKFYFKKKKKKNFFATKFNNETKKFCFLSFIKDKASLTILTTIYLLKNLFIL